MISENFQIAPNNSDILKGKFSGAYNETIFLLIRVIAPLKNMIRSLEFSEDAELIGNIIAKIVNNYIGYQIWANL